FDEPGPVGVVLSELLPAGCGFSASLPLGREADGMLQLLFATGDAPSPAELERLKTFAVRAAHALSASERARSLALELGRTRALLAVVGQATAELSLTHTLETAVEHVADLLAVEDIAVYLRGDEDRL